ARHATVASGPAEAKRIIKQHQAKTKGDQHALVRDFLSRLESNSAKIDLLVKTPKDGLVEIFYGLGEALAGEGGLTPGMLYLQMALYLEPDHAFALAAFAGALESTRQYKRAIEVYDRIPADTPLHTAIEIRKAFNLNSLEKVDDARKTLVALLEQEDGAGEAERAKAAEQQRELLAAGPKPGSVLGVGSAESQVKIVQQSLVSLGFDIGSVDGLYGEATRKAVMQFQKTNDLDVDGVVGPETYTALVRSAGPLTYDNRLDRANQLQVLDAIGNILRARKMYAEAIGYYDRAIALLPKPRSQDWVYFYARGTCHEREKNWPLAEADLKKAMSLVPDQPLVLNYLGYSWIDQGINLKAGLKLIERAVALKPDDGYIVDSLGWAHFKLGNIKQAVLFLERAVELRPDDPILNDHLGDALWRAGRQREARFQWEQALTLRPEPEEAEKIRAKIRTGLLVPIGSSTQQATKNAARETSQSGDRKN
ncbi:MAG: peptidoglycan-binding protein, partial [Alphaproteobacteria bacterium]|nr:peptidoglycan-binding protein [Alphaproteobacteria bacterium]